jgi:hypothetical protein
MGKTLWSLCEWAAVSATRAKTALRGRNRGEGFLRFDDLQASQGDPYTSYITPPEYSFPSCKGAQFFHLSASSREIHKTCETRTSHSHQPLLTSESPSVSVLSYSRSPSNPLSHPHLLAHYAHLSSTHSVLDREAINAFLSAYSYDHLCHALVYKPVAKKVRTVPTTMPAEYRVVCQLPEDPLAGMPELPTHLPEFIPGSRFTCDRANKLDLDPANWLWPEELKLMRWLVRVHE